MSINWSLYEKKIKINGNSFKERQIDFMKSAILDDFENNPSYTEVYFNNSDIITGIQIVDDKYGLKKVLMKPDENINAGDLLEFNSNKWLCINVDKENPVYQYGTIQKTTNTLKYYDKNHNLYQIPCIVDSNTRFQDLRLEENKFISEPDDKITIRIAYSDITKNIERGQIFKLIDNDNYKVISVNKVTEPGLIVLKMEYSVEEAETHTYSISILNGDTVNIQEGYTLQLNVGVYDNGTLLSPTPLLTFTSSDELICNVDSSGLITTNELNSNNSCVVTVSLASDSNISKDIVVNVIQMPIINSTYEIVGSYDIIKGQTQTYTVNKYNNGVLVTDSNFIFSILPGSTPESAYVLNVLGDNKCSITANASNCYITLRATDSNMIQNYLDKTIRMKNLF